MRDEGGEEERWTESNCWIDGFAYVFNILGLVYNVIEVSDSFCSASSVRVEASQHCQYSIHSLCHHAIKL